MTIGREPITIIEIDQDFCTRTYGVAPCTASVGVTGDRKCFNTRRTCQDAPNYDIGTLTLRFCTPHENPSRSAVLIPTVMSVSTVPTEINIAGTDKNISALGRRASVTITLADAPHHDRGIDPYADDRGYDPMTRGTFWSKWLARNPYYTGRALRVRDGYIGQDLSEFSTRHYIIDRITGPVSGRVTIVAKDPLKLTDADRAQAPAPSRGFVLTDFEADATSFILTPEGVGNLDYPASGVIRIGGELISYTRAADVMTMTARGLRGTETEAHEAGDVVQQVLIYDRERVDAVMYDLLSNYTQIAPSLIDYAEWASEAAKWLSGFKVSTWITEPTGVGILLGELQNQCLCYIWWDERDQEVKFRAIRPLLPTDTSTPMSWQSEILAGSMQMDVRPDERLSQVWVYYGQIDPTQKLDDVSNYRRVRIRADLPAEGDDQYREQRIRKIFSRWMNSANDTETLALSARMLNRFRENPTIITLGLDAKDRAIQIADVVVITHPDLVDDTGDALPRTQQVVAYQDTEVGHSATIKTRPFDLTGRYAFVMENDALDYSSTAPEGRVIAGFIAPDSGLFSDGSEAYKVI